MTINNFKTINDFLEEKKVKSNFFSQEINLFLDFLSKKTKSSYKVNNFGKIFIYLSYHLKPKIIYELGVLGCYSLLSIGYGQKLLNKEKNKYTKSYGNPKNSICCSHQLLIFSAAATSCGQLS